MRAFYTHCPHCGFPAVVNAVERAFLRRCRQCREEFLPKSDGASNSVRPGVGAARERIALRARLQRQRKSIS